MSFLPMGESAVYNVGVGWYYVDRGEHESMKNISCLEEITTRQRVSDAQGPFRRAELPVTCDFPITREVFAN